MSIKALARIGSPRSAITNVAELTARMREIQDIAFVCSPFANIDSIPEFFRISERVVTIDPDPAKQEVYFSPQFCKPGEVALTKPGLMKLWLASGGQVIASRRTDDRSDPHLCSWEVIGEYRQIDGNIVRVHGNRTLDYRDGSEQIKGLKPGDIAQKRRAIQGLSETFALERMQRSGINLLQKYKAADLGSKPFVCYALVQDVSREQDPVIRRMAAAQAFGMVRELYGDAGGQAALTGAPPPAGLIETANGTTVSARTGEVIDEPESGDFPDFHDEPPPPEPEIIVCGCECGDQAEIDPEAEAASVRNLGGPRCAQCYPGPAFDLGRHAQMKRMGYPKLAHYTPADAHERAKKARGGAR